MFLGYAASRCTSLFFVFPGGKVGPFSDWEKTWKKTLHAIPENQGCPSRNRTLFPQQNV